MNLDARVRSLERRKGADEHEDESANPFLATLVEELEVRGVEPDDVIQDGTVIVGDQFLGTLQAIHAAHERLWGPLVRTVSPEELALLPA